MALMRWNQQIVAGREIDVFLSFDRQGRRTLQKDHPLRVGLIVPKPGRARVAMGDDLFDAQPVVGEELMDVLTVRGIVSSSQEVSDGSCHIGPHAYLQPSYRSTRLALRLSIELTPLDIRHDRVHRQPGGCASGTGIHLLFGRGKLLHLFLKHRPVFQP